MSTGHGQKLNRKREQAIAALLSEATVEQAAAKAGVGYATLRRWLQEPGFVGAYRHARRRRVEGAVGRIQVATGQAVDTLVAVAKNAAKDGDRVRAAVALLDYAFRGMTDADTLHGDRGTGDAAPMD